MLPIETVVELLIENAAPAKCGGGQIMLGGELYDSLREDDLRGYIRTYLESLVPAPKLLSECEEGVWFESTRSVQRYKEHAYDPGGVIIGRASSIQVIQPAEVNRD